MPYTTTQKRLLTAAAGLGVATLTGAAFLLTYDDLRALAAAGGAAERWRPAYPIMVDALIAVTILSLVLARHTRWWTRLIRWTLLVVLLAGAGAAGVQRALKGYGSLPEDPLRAGVAAAPLVMIALAVWLWLTMFKHARTALTRRPAAAELPELPVEDEGAPDLIPGLTKERPALPPAPPAPAAPPASEPEHGHEPDEDVRRWVVEEHWLDDGPPVELTPRGPEPDDDPTPPAGAALLETDVELVRGRPRASTTQPDLIPFDLEPLPEPLAGPVPEPPGHSYDPVPEPSDRLYDPVPELVQDPVQDPVPEPVHEPPYEPASEPLDEPLHEPPSEPFNEPASGLLHEPADARLQEPASEPADERPEDPDAGEDSPPTRRDRAESEEWTEVSPPSSTFRSSPTPPGDRQ